MNINVGQIVLDQTGCRFLGCVDRVTAQLRSLNFGLVACIALTGCVSGSPTPPSDLASVLTPSQIEQSIKPEDSAALTNESVLSESTPLSSKPDESSPAKTALATSSSAKTTAVAKTLEKQITKKPRKPIRTSAVKRPKTDVQPTRNRHKKGLPGVHKKFLFGLFSSRGKERNLEKPIRHASLATLAKRGTFGLKLQTKNVQVGCFPAKLVRILKRVQRRYGRVPIVTSGYRSKAKNRKIRGARNSTHISCKAADIQVPGVSKWKLAKYLRSVPGRGGVGTYCHTNSVHIDVGKKRNWNWRCRRRKRR